MSTASTPAKLLPYKTLPEWTAGAIPAGFLRPHNTREGTWAQLQVLAGTLDFALTSADGQVLERFTFTPERQPPLIAPQQWHQILAASADARCQLRFLCTPEDFFGKKHGLTRTHSELIEAYPRLHPRAQPPRALDVGCGRGRNSLYLALQGWQVDALEQSDGALATLAELAAQEGLQARLRLRQTDLNDAPRQTLLDSAGAYDLVLCTVVLMFLQPPTIAPLIAQMQAATAPGGCNLIVCAMDTPDHPCTQPFPFTFQPGGLRAHYEGWELLKYNEDLGHLHKTDANGQPIALRFATMLARKPAA
ncbi:SAM-dependent methyltransferase TehB [Comamonadaceae bacterium OH2545_COT-014]|nr:SAM-dependent methyltransferase TehB [Comamonadaceae bacterium OH2545_COT-014]